MKCTAKPSQLGSDDSEVLKFNDFQGPLTSNSKTFKALLHFQGLSRPWKNGEKNFKDFQGRVATLISSRRLIEMQAETGPKRMKN